MAKPLLRLVPKDAPLVESNHQASVNSSDEGGGYEETDKVKLFISTKSRGSQFGYRRSWRLWTAYLASMNTIPEEATALQVATFFKKRESDTGKRARYGSNTQLSGATLHKEHALLKSIYSGAFNVNPFTIFKLGMKKSYNHKRTTEMVPFEKVEELINVPSKYTPTGIRDRAMLAILFGGGLREGEAVNLTIEDVKLSEKGTYYLMLRATKNGSDADQSLPAWAVPYLEALLERRKKETADRTTALFCHYSAKGNPTNKALSHMSVYRVFKTYCAQLGLPPSLSPHSARATAITKLLADGLDYREVQEFSRHSSVQMVELYDKRSWSIDDSPAKKLSFSKGTPTSS